MPEPRFRSCILAVRALRQQFNEPCQPPTSGIRGHLESRGRRRTDTNRARDIMGNLSTRLRSSSPWSRRLTQRSLESRRPRTVTVDYNRLELFLNDFVATRAKRGESLGWLGLITGLVAALVSADFNYQDTRLGLTGAQWQTLSLQP